MSNTEASVHGAYLGRKYFLELDGLRALSVLLVITYHLPADAWGNWQWLGGGRGVAVFFVLSGFLITTLAVREEERRGHLSLAAFYVRRCCRILPLFYLTLAVYCVLIFGLAMRPELSKPLRDMLPYYLSYVQEWPYYFRPAADKALAFSHSWTLGIEEKFYLIWPLIAFAFWRGSAARRLRGAAILTLGLGLFIFLLEPFGPAARVVGRMLFGYCSLLTGCVLALLLHDPRWFGRLRRLVGAKATAASAFLLLAAQLATHWVSASPWAQLLNLLFTLAAVALLACVLLGDGPLQRLLRWRPLAFVGRLSYGVYLIHMLCMTVVCKALPALSHCAGGNLVIFPLVCLLSIAVAWGLHIAVESPCIELGRRWSRRITDGRATAKPSRQSVPVEPATADGPHAPLFARG